MGREGVWKGGRGGRGRGRGWEGGRWIQEKGEGGFYNSINIDNNT